MTKREQLIEDIRRELDPSLAGIVRECFREVERLIQKLPQGYFSDEAPIA